MSYLASGYLPFLVVVAEEGFVAIQEDRDGYAVAGHPVITHLDGRPIADWIEAAKTYVAQGSPQFILQRCARQLRFLQRLRRELGLPETSRVRIRVTRSDGSDPVEEQLEIAGRKPTYGEWPRSSSRTIDGQIAYLRLASMSPRSAVLHSLDDTMDEFRDTKALIIDVRGNSGGSRDALRQLAPYLLTKKHSALVANVGCLRVGLDAGTGTSLSDRFLWPRDHYDSKTAAGRTVGRIARSFRPEWALNRREFGPWHYMVLTSEDNPRAYAYPGKVVVLIDPDCFSATDIFVGALERLPQVTLMGTPTGGGSGRSRGDELVESEFHVRLSTMASFRPDSRLYDGRGIEPDVEVAPQASDFVGDTDRVLDAALDFLR